MGLESVLCTMDVAATIDGKEGVSAVVVAHPSPTGPMLLTELDLLEGWNRAIESGRDPASAPVGAIWPLRRPGDLSAEIRKNLPVLPFNASVASMSLHGLSWAQEVNKKLMPQMPQAVLYAVLATSDHWAIVFSTSEMAGNAYATSTGRYRCTGANPAHRFTADEARGSKQCPYDKTRLKRIN